MQKLDSEEREREWSESERRGGIEIRGDWVEEMRPRGGGGRERRERRRRN